MQIALCDDEERQLDLLEGFLRAYEAEHGMDLTLTRFSSGEALLAAPEEFSIVFMDIYLDGLLGTEAIRRLGGEARWSSSPPAGSTPSRPSAWGPSTIC